jgi:hypothetical protein
MGAAAKSPAAGSWLERNSLLVVAALILLGSLRIVSTYTVFSQTTDEPAHIATGMEWLDQGRYRYEPLHPPLARAAAALGPFLDGRASQGQPDMWREGQAILGQGGDYDRTLALARLGILPFFWIACLVVYGWGRRYFNRSVACLAVLIFSMLPPVLAHSGLATTDMALTAMTGTAFLCTVIWCDSPGPRTSLCLGLSTGLAVLAKFSALLFLPASLCAAAAAYLLLERPRPQALVAQARRRFPGLALATALALLVVWAGYRFSYGEVPGCSWRLPFPELFLGLRQLAALEHRGGNNYLLGQHQLAGWWYFYLVVLALKTPLSVPAMAAAGTLPAARRAQPRGWWLALAFSAGILLPCLFSRINLGVRHILPVYLGLSLIAAAGIRALLDLGGRWRPAPWIAGALLLELVASSALAHPDYLAYFNVLGGAHPERILAESDLDWGQDMKRLAQRLRQLGVRSLTFTPCMMALDPAALGLPPLSPNDFLHPAPGWNAVRLTQLELLAADTRAEHPQLRLWPDVIPPAERIGGILLFHFGDSLPPAPAWLPTAHVYCS